MSAKARLRLMTCDDHLCEAEELLAKAEVARWHADRLELLAEAQVHATLAAAKRVGDGT